MAHGFFGKLFRPACKPADAITKQDLLIMHQSILDALAVHAGLIIGALKETENKLMATQKEIADGIAALRAQNAKIANEQAARFDKCQERIKALEDAINAGGNASPEVVEALAGLKADMQAFDDVIPDEVTPG